MSKKKIFDFNLFIEGIRQLKIIGFIFLIIFLAEAFLIPYNYYNPSSVEYTLDNFQPMLYGMHMFFVPCMTLYLFGFLLKRNSSDFFQSIPHTRTCVFVSFFSSILFWIACIMSVSSIVSVVSSYAMINDISINGRALFLSLIGIFVASITVVAGICIAQSITGTILSNVIVSGLILIAPKVFSLFILGNISGKTAIFSGEHFSPLLTGKYNLVTFFISNFYSGSYSDCYMSHIYILYTFVLFIIFFTVALILFNIRKSETAGNAASNPILQHIYRIVFTMLMCLIPINQIVMDSDDFRSIVSIYVFIAIAYFVYEILTTRMLRNIPKAIPGLIIVALLNVLLIFGINAIVDGITSYTPDAGSLKSIRLYTSETDDSAYNFGNYYITITDEKNIESFCRILKNTVNKTSYEIELDEDNFYNYYQVCFIDNSGEKHFRHLPLKASSIKNAINVVAENNTDISFPSLPSPEFVYISEENTSDPPIALNYRFTYNEMQDFYKAFIEDYNNMSADKKLDYIFNISNTDSANYIDKFNVSYGNMYIQFYVSAENENLYNAYFDIIKKIGIVDTEDILNNFEDKILSCNENEYVDILDVNDNYLFDLSSDDPYYGFDSSDKYETFLSSLKDLSQYVIDSPEDIKDYLISKKEYTKISLAYTIKYNDRFYYSIPILLENNEEVRKILKTINKLSD